MPETVDTSTIQEIQQRIAKALEALPELDRHGRLPEELRPLAHYLAPPPGKTSVVILRNKKGEERTVRETAGAERWDLEGSTALISHEESTNGKTPKSCEADSKEPQDKEEELKKPREHSTTAWGFKPVRIKGEPLSATILADRR